MGLSDFSSVGLNGRVDKQLKFACKGRFILYKLFLRPRFKIFQE